ncbi:MAG: hemerythrin domain-containing protein [Nanoarchaeota archaeon]
MTQVGPITKLMLKQHAFLNKLLFEFNEIPSKKIDKAKEVFANFRWNLEKHFFIEEHNLFPVTNSQDDEEVILMNRLLQEHKDIMIVVNNLTEELLDGRIPKINKLKPVLFNHEQREIKMFYPKFDKFLKISEKEYIIEKIGDINLN